MTYFAPLEALVQRRELSVPPASAGRPAASPAAALLVLGLMLAGCGGDDGPGTQPPTNALPQITSVTATPRRTLTHMQVRAIAVARDADHVLLRYSWSATRGGFPLSMAQSSVSWLSPDEPGLDSLTVYVTDMHDTVSASVPVLVESVEPPSSLVAAIGTSIADLRWTVSSDEAPDSTWQGYEVFAATRSLGSIPRDSLSAYRIAGPVTTSSYRASGLSRGTIYHFGVGSLRAWGPPDNRREERSPLAPEIDIAPRAEWTKQLQEVRNPAGGLALDLSAGEVRALNPADVSGNGVYARDLYFGTSDSLDGPGPAGNPAKPRIKSVSLLANRNAEWARHRVRVKRLGSDWTVSTVSDDGWGEEADLELGAVYAVKTSEGNYAKLLVADLPTAVSPYRQLTVKWAYQSIPGYPRF